MALDLAYESVGDGPPILILHGLFGSASNWRGIAKVLARTHRVISVDLRNHGDSPWADSMSYPEMADDVLHLIEQEGLERPAIMGHSMGGKTAMALALLHPKRVGALIVVDIAPVSYADHLFLFTDAMRGAGMLGTFGHADAWERWTRLVPVLMQPPALGNALVDWRTNVPGIATAIQCLSAFPAELREMRCPQPVHVIAGGCSGYVARLDGAEFRPMFEQVEVEVIGAAGHWVHAELPQRFLDCVAAALRDMSLATPVLVPAAMPA
ncbi:alpha/beta fold hydrolase [Paraburkholderia sp.]|uniref:alpha/beta fold hydrolase n=1 Tax=Paraburkholderia sp. TaxID=1926495 RepID=UPI003C7AB42B